VRVVDIAEQSSAEDFVELDQVERASAGCPGKDEAGRLGERAVFGFSPLESARSPQHVKIAHGALAVLGIYRGKFWHDPLDHYQPTARWKRIPTLAQYDLAPIVRPVMHYALHQDRVGATRDGFEEVARDEPATVGNPESIKMLSRFYFAACKIEGYPLDIRVVEQHAADQFA
jgi:hypothetical protein